MRVNTFFFTLLIPSCRARFRAPCDGLFGRRMCDWRLLLATDVFKRKLRHKSDNAELYAEHGARCISKGPVGADAYWPPGTPRYLHIGVSGYYNRGQWSAKTRPGPAAIATASFRLAFPHFATAEVAAPD